VRVTKIVLSGKATASGVLPVFVIKRSAADSSGTPATATVVPHDSADAAGTGVFKTYTANPTPGAAVGNVCARRMTFQAAASLGAPPLVIDFTNRNEKGIVLRGTAENLAVNFNGVTLVGGETLDVEITWTEE